MWPDPLSGGGSGGDDSPAPPSRSKAIKCEFCESTLAPSSGDVLRVSEKAKGFREQDETIAKLQKDLKASETRNKELEGTVETLRQEIEDAKRPRSQGAPPSDPPHARGLIL